MRALIALAFAMCACHRGGEATTTEPVRNASVPDDPLSDLASRIPKGCQLDAVIAAMTRGRSIDCGSYDDRRTGSADRNHESGRQVAPRELQRCAADALAAKRTFSVRTLYWHPGIDSDLGTAYVSIARRGGREMYKLQYDSGEPDDPDGRHTSIVKCAKLLPEPGCTTPTATLCLYCVADVEQPKELSICQ